MIIDFHHTAFQCSDFDKAFDFFHRVFGFEVIKGPNDFKSRRLCYLKRGHLIVELYSGKKEAGPLEPYHSVRGGLDHLSFIVDDIKAAIEYLGQQNVPIIKMPFRPPTEDPDQPWVAFIEGPDGQEIELRSGP